MGCESSPEDASYRVLLLLSSLWHHCLLLLVLKPLFCEDPTLIQPLPTYSRHKGVTDSRRAMRLPWGFAADAVREDCVFWDHEANKT